MKEQYITCLINSGLFSDIDIHFAAFISSLTTKKDKAITLAAALVSQATGNGHICIDLEKTWNWLVSSEQTMDIRINCEDYQAWRDRLMEAKISGAPGTFKPLILDSGNRLYLYRYWDYEKKLFELIQQRLSSNKFNKINKKILLATLERLFPFAEKRISDSQQTALLSALLHRFCVISGGPGTGKTTTAARIILAFLEQSPQTDSERIILAAPTGKAASRMTESIHRTLVALADKKTVKKAELIEASTIHRLLQPIHGTPYFRFCADHPLSADLIIVDEASMVDVALMSKLIEAVPPDASIVLMGDKDQLASVEAGSVIGDICGSHLIYKFSADFQKEIKDLADIEIAASPADTLKNKGLYDQVVVLTENYRFPEGSGIERLSRFVNTGNAQGAMEVLRDPGNTDVTWENILSQHDLKKKLHNEIVNGYKACFNANDPHEALVNVTRYQILCAVKSGYWGVHQINRFAEHILEQEGLIPGAEVWYKGMPIMITKNHYDLDLYNGDMGIIMPETGSDDHKNLFAFFMDKAGGLKRLALHKLPDFERTYAITIHKSQGSEFENIMIVLPGKDYPVLTRELIYTGITRASVSVTLLGNETVFVTAVSRKTQRTSGLRERFWG